MLKTVKNKGAIGYGWASPNARWCATIKTATINNHIKEKHGANSLQYIGIAFDEQKRMKLKKYPLIEWEMTERDCIEYCYSLGFDWEGLYEKYRRLSCWCCPLQSIKDLRLLWSERPQLWQRLLEMDERVMSINPIECFFRPYKTVPDMQIRFELEEKYLAAGLDIKSRAFFREWKELIGLGGGGGNNPC